MTTSFCPDRLKLARHRNRLSKVELARRANLSVRRLSAFENEGAEPPPATLELLATVLDYPTNFFFRECVGSIDQDTVSFRSFSRMAARDREAALAAAELAAELSAWIGARFVLPDVDLPDLHGVRPDVAAAALRSEWGLGVGPAPNLIHLLESKGIRVFALVHDCAALDALSTWIEGQPFVFLGQSKSAERSRWDAAHELAHLVLHHDAPPQTRAHEAEADAFAAEFLMPRDGFAATVPRVVSLNDVRQHKTKWKVSAVAWIRRAFDLGRISEWTYRNLVIEASQAGLRSHENDIEREESRVFAMVSAMLREDGISVADIADSLAIPAHEVRDLMFSPSLLQDQRPTLRIVRDET